MDEINKKTRSRRNEAISRTVDEKNESKKPKEFENPYLSDVKQEKQPVTEASSMKN